MTRIPTANEGGLTTAPCEKEFSGVAFKVKQGDPILLTWTNNHDDGNKYHVKVAHQTADDSGLADTANLVFNKEYSYYQYGFTRETVNAPSGLGVYTLQFEWANNNFQCVDFEVVSSDCSCYDGEMNGDEKGVDCGGSCFECATATVTAVKGCEDQSDGTTINCGRADGAIITLVGTKFAGPLQVQVDKLPCAVTGFSATQVTFQLPFPLKANPQPEIWLLSNGTAQSLTGMLSVKGPSMNLLVAENCYGDALELWCPYGINAGTPISIGGADFYPEGDIQVYFNGMPGESVDWRAPNVVVSPLPDGIDHCGDISIKVVAGGQETTQKAEITFDEPDEPMSTGVQGDLGLPESSTGSAPTIPRDSSSAVSQEQSGEQPTANPPKTVTASGCPSEGCPTEQGTLVTVEGTGFGSGSTVWLGDQQLHVNSSSGSSLSFELPELTGGSSQIMVWIQNGDGDLSFSFIDVAAPAITAISSDACDNDSNNLSLVDFPTQSKSSKITISGSNFGASGAQVFVGGVKLQTTHDSTDPHSKLICSYPADNTDAFLPGTTAPLTVQCEGGAMSAEQSALAFSACPDNQIYLEGQCQEIPADMCSAGLSQQDTDASTEEDDCGAAGLLYPTIPVVVILAGQQLL